MDNAYNLFGYEDSPNIISLNTHKNAHNDALRDVELIMPEILPRALKSDNKIMEDKKWISEQNKLGKSYATEMGNEFYKVIRDRVGKTNEALDEDPDFISFKEKYHKEFKKLSNTAKLAATYKILMGFESMNDKVTIYKKNARWPKTFIPTSKTPGEISLLDHVLVSKFFEFYNKALDSKYRKTTDLSRGYKGLPIESIINRACKG